MGHLVDDDIAVLLLGVHPASHLVEGQRVGGEFGRKLVDLDHCLANGGSSFIQFGNKLGIIEDTAWNLAVSTAKTQNKVQSRLFLDVVVTQRSSIFKLLARKDETLLVRRDAFLVLNLGLYILDGVRWLHIQSDGLTGKGLDENLHRAARKEGKKGAGFHEK